MVWTNINQRKQREGIIIPCELTTTFTVVLLLLLSATQLLKHGYLVIDETLIEVCIAIEA